MSMNKPIKPTNLIPRSFGGIKRNFSNSLQLTGYEPDIPAIYGGDNLNYQLDATGKELDYCEKIIDFINAMPIGKMLTVDANNRLAYGDIAQEIPVATNDILGICKPDGTTVTIDENGVLSAQSLSRYLVSSYINGTTWYRIYSDGWKEQGGYVATTATDLPWGQPTLSGDNGTLGGNSFAVAASAQHTTSGYSNYAWKAFDNNDSTMWTAGTNNAYPYTITIFNPTPLKVSSILMSNRTDTATFIAKSGTVEASNTNSGYTTIANWTNSTEGKKARWSISVNSPSYYKYHRISIATSSFNGQYTPGAMEIDLTATYQGSGSNGVVFPISFNNTNYSFTLGFQGAAGSNVYISSKSTTGFSLNNTSSSSICWMACGY